jgi:hypothetical protein
MPSTSATSRKNFSDTRRVGARSRSDRLRKLDGRRKEARRLAAITADLVAHVGGQPSAAQSFLIDRAALDILRLEMLDAEMVAGTFSEHDGRIAHALRNSVRLILRDLGLQPVPPKFDRLGSPPAKVEYTVIDPAANANDEEPPAAAASDPAESNQ